MVVVMVVVVCGYESIVVFTWLWHVYSLAGFILHKLQNIAFFIISKIKCIYIVKCDV